MPTLLTIDGFRVYFYSHEPDEPPHVHVDRGDASAKVWLEPVALARNLGYPARQLTRIVAMVREHRAELLEAWLGYFGDRR